jgi:hypothetical protein
VKTEDKARLPSNPSDSTRRRNPHLFGPGAAAPVQVATPGVRVRQNSKPMSKGEREWFAILKASSPPGSVHAHALTFLLANGVRYTPDFVVMPDERMTCYEVKGKHQWEDAMVKIKMAPAVWPNVKWVLVWKDGADWKRQDVLPPVS